MVPMFDLPAMRQRLNELDSERGTLLQLIQAAERYAAHRQPMGWVQMPLQQQRKPQSLDKTVQQITEDVALQRMKATGRPVQTREIVQIMEAENLPLPEKNILNVVSARLSNSSRLEGRRGQGWWEAGKPWPEDVLDGANDGHHLNENGEAEASPESADVGSQTTSSDTFEDIIGSSSNQ